MYLLLGNMYVINTMEYECILILWNMNVFNTMEDAYFGEALLMSTDDMFYEELEIIYPRIIIKYSSIRL